MKNPELENECIFIQGASHMFLTSILKGSTGDKAEIMFDDLLNMYESSRGMNDIFFFAALSNFCTKENIPLERMQGLLFEALQNSEYLDWLMHGIEVCKKSLAIHNPFI